MAVRVAINGFGRIGRNILRAIAESGRRDIQVVAINDLGPVETNAHLLRYDFVHGRFPGTVTVEGDSIDLGNFGTGTIKVSAERDPVQVAAERLDVPRDGMHRHLHGEGQSLRPSDGRREARAGLRTGDGADATIVYGINEKTLTKDHLVISNGSCTTNCLAPIAKILHDTFGIDPAS